MERYAPTAKDLASRDVVSRSMTIEIREGRLVPELFAYCIKTINQAIYLSLCLLVSQPDSQLFFMPIYMYVSALSVCQSVNQTVTFLSSCLSICCVCLLIRKSQ